MPDTVTLTREPVTRYEIDETGRIFVETRTRLMDGDTVVSEQVHRRPIEPDADVKAETAEVKALAALVRTPERLAKAVAISEAARA